MDPKRLHLAAVVLIVAGCLALAASAWQHRAASDDFRNQAPGARGIDLLEERFDRAAVAAALGIGLLSAGPAVLVLARANTVQRPKRARLAGWAALAGAALATAARLRTFDVAAMSDDWAFWMGLEGLGWLAIAAALGAALWMARTAPAEDVQAVPPPRPDRPA